MAALRFRQIDAAYLLIFCTLVILCFKAAITGGRSVASLPSVASYAQSHGAGWRTSSAESASIGPSQQSPFPLAPAPAPAAAATAPLISVSPRPGPDPGLSPGPGPGSSSVGQVWEQQSQKSPEPATETQTQTLTWPASRPSPSPSLSPSLSPSFSLSPSPSLSPSLSPPSPSSNTHLRTLPPPYTNNKWRSFSRDPASFRPAARNPFSSQLPSLQRCVLPPNARWCTVRIYGLKSFELAVYAGFGFNGGDIVSQELCSSGSWEFRSMSTFGPAGQALDIGGNLGVYSFALAAAGWNVTTFEPMPINLARIKASLCRNPDLAKRIHLMEVGLGEKNQRCQFISGRDNTGDGNARCGVEMNRPVPPLYADRGIFDIIRLDDALEKLGIEKIDYVKLDVEGFECNVLRGGQSLFTKYRPRLFQSEVWPNMQRCSPREYLDMYEKAGYTVARDPRCQRPYKHGPTGISDYWMCRGRSLRALGASAPLLLQRRD